MGSLATRTSVPIEEMLEAPTLSAAFLRISSATPDRERGRGTIAITGQALSVDGGISAA
jgi:hypothetical protein